MARILVTSFLGFNLEKLLEEQKINSSPSLEQTVDKHTVQQGIHQSIPDQMHDSHSLVGSKTHSFVKQSSHVLPQVFVKDIDSKPSVVSIPVEPEGQSEVDATQVKLSSRLKTKGWAPKLINKPTVTPKEVCIFSIDSHINGGPLCNQHNQLGLLRMCFEFGDILKALHSCIFGELLKYLQIHNNYMIHFLLHLVVSPIGTRSSVCTCGV